MGKSREPANPTHLISRTMAKTSFFFLCFVLLLLFLYLSVLQSDSSPILNTHLLLEKVALLVEGNRYFLFVTF